MRPLLRTAFLLTFLVACGTYGGASIDGEDDSPISLGAGPLEELPELTATAAQPSLIAHEWGTFTSVVTSDGATLEGLHHEEHRLPSFVYGRASDANYFECPPTKCLEMHPEGVTQKLETPVIYFYADEEIEVSVEVEFPEGILSEWYPDATAFAPALYDWDDVAGGMMSWDVTVRPGDAAIVPVPEDDIWAPSRRVAATPVVYGDEEEMFIFYRGLGDFTLPFAVTSNPDGSLLLRNDSRDDIPHVFVHNVDEESEEGMIASFGALPAGAELLIEDTTFMPGPKESPLPVAELVEFASDLVFEQLVATGLYEDEARAMVDTWSESYFAAEGLRVLYVVPRAWTDALLPIDIEPAPTELVRTMVGRVEVLTPLEELEVVDLVTACAATNDMGIVGELGRFAEPKLRRALELIDDSDVRRFVEEAIELASVAP